MISPKNSSFKISVGIRNATDFSPFGVELKGRNFEVVGGGNYRYSFQGQESDPEIKGEGNSVNFSFRMHDPRLGRFFAIDPLTAKYPHYTPYSFSGNKVIYCRELEGLEEFVAIKKGDSFIIVWDITARDRKGEEGHIQYVNDAGDIIEKMRPMNEFESKNSFIATRLETPQDSPLIDHDATGTPLSLQKPSTGLYSSDRKYISREALVNEKALVKPVPVVSLKKEIVKTKKSLTDAKVKEFEKSFSGASIIGFKSSGSSLTPIVNLGKGFGTTQDVGSLLKGFEYTSLNVHLELGTANKSMIYPSSPANYAKTLLEGIKSELIKAGVPRGKINGTSSVNPKGETDIKFKIIK